MECFWWKFNLIRLSRENSFGKNRFRRTWERFSMRKFLFWLCEKQFQGKTKRLEKSTESCVGLARLKPLPSSGCFCWNSQRALRWEKETKQLQTRRLTQTKHEMKQKMTENREKIIMEKNETETKAQTCSRRHIISEAFVKPNQLI
jgi:hypothetical protein